MRNNVAKDTSAGRHGGNGQPVVLSPVQLTVRCLLERDGDQRQAFSIDFGLAAQAESALEARKKLESMIESYLHDALAGEDRDHAYELLTRKAPAAIVFRYHIYSMLSLVRKARSNRIVYRRPMPLEPTGYAV